MSNCRCQCAVTSHLGPNVTYYKQGNNSNGLMYPCKAMLYKENKHF